MYHLQCVAQLHRTVPCPPAGIETSDQVGTVPTLSPSLLETCSHAFLALTLSVPFPCSPSFRVSLSSLFPLILFPLFPCSPLFLFLLCLCSHLLFLFPLLGPSYGLLFARSLKPDCYLSQKKADGYGFYALISKVSLTFMFLEPVIKTCLALLEEQLPPPLRHK